MAVTLVQPGNLTFGCSTETGVDIESVTSRFAVDYAYRVNGSGENIGFAARNQRLELSLTGEISGTTGLAAAVLSAKLTTANLVSNHGVTTGDMWIKKITVSVGRESWKKITIDAVRNPTITVTA